MVRSVIITGENLVASSAPYNDTYKYTVPTGMVDLRNHEVAIASVNLWYSWYNISAERQNNTFSYKFPVSDGGGGTTYQEVSVTIPDGNYSIDPDNNTLNAYLQFVMVQNKHYLIDDITGDYIYYMEIVRNVTTNLAEIVCYAVPTSLPANSKQPTDPGWDFPANGYCPQITLPTGFARILGFTPQSVPPTDTNVGDYYTTGTSRTLFYPVTNVIIGCSLLHNTLSIPNTSLFQFPITDQQFNSQIGNAYNFAYQPVDSGYYSEFTIRFFDQKGNRLQLGDTDIGVYMIFRKRTDDSAITK